MPLTPLGVRPRRWTVAVLLAVLVSPLPSVAQPTSAMTIVVPSFEARVAVNVARSLHDALLPLLDGSDGIDVVPWSETVSRARVRGASFPGEPASTCLAARQLAAMAGLDAILCGTVEPLRDGTFAVDAVVVESSTAADVRLPRVVAADPAELGPKLAQAVRDWARSRAPDRRSERHPHGVPRT